MSRKSRPHRARGQSRPLMKLAKVRSLENPGFPLSAALEDDTLCEALGMSRSASGLRVSSQTALTYAAVWRAIHLVSSALAKMPLNVLMRVGANKDRDITHPAYYLVKRKPNEFTTAFLFKQTLQAHVLIHGNAYAFIERNGDADPTALLILSPTDTYPVRAGGQLWYVTTVNGEPHKLAAANVLHIKGLGFDGMLGYSVIAKARESLALGMAASKFGLHFFKNGVRASGILMYPGKMKPDAVDHLRHNWEKMQTGLSNAARLIILQDGVKFQQLTIPPNEAQFLETRQHEVRDVANWFGVPSHKLGDKEGQAYNSLEQENQSWLDDSIDPWAVNWEEELSDKLLTEKEKRADSHYCAFERKALVRADMTARGAFYEKALKNRWMLPDEVRAREDMNPLPNGDGQKLLPLPNESIKPEQKMRAVASAFCADAVTRMVKRVATHARRAAASPEKFERWLAAELADHRAPVAAALAPGCDDPARACAAADELLARLAQALAAAESQPAAIDAALDRCQRELPPLITREIFTPAA